MKNRPAWLLALCLLFSLPLFPASSGDITVPGGGHYRPVDGNGDPADLDLTGGLLTLDGADPSTAITVGGLVLGPGAAFAGTGKVNASSLAVSAFSAFIDEEGVDTVVAGDTVVENGANYFAAGAGNRYGGDIAVLGGAIFGSADSSAVTVTAGGPGRDSFLILDRGVLASFDGAFRIARAGGAGTHTVLVKNANPYFGSLVAGGGLLDLSESRIMVHVDDPSDAVGIDSDTGIRAQSYVQLNGTVVNTTLPSGTGKMVVLDGGVVGGLAGSSAVYETAGDHTRFIGGLTVAANGAIRGGAGGGGVVALGSGDPSRPVDGRIDLAGDASLDGLTKGALALADAAGNGGAVLAVGGTGNRVLGNVDADAFRACVASGASLAVAGAGTGPSPDGLRVRSMDVRGELVLGGADGAGRVETGEGLAVGRDGVLRAGRAGAVLVNRGASGSLDIAGGGLVSAAHGDIAAAGYSRTVIAGTYEAGRAGGAVAGLTTDSDIEIRAGGVVSITDDLAMNAGVGDVILATTNGSLVNNANQGVASLFGQYGFAVRDGGGGFGQEMYISSIRNRASGDGSGDDRRLALGNLHDMWGGSQIGPDLGDIVYDASARPPNTRIDPPGNASGQKNMELLAAVGSPSGKNIDLGTLEYVNGAMLNGPAAVAVEVSRAFASGLGFRAGELRRRFASARAAGSPDAADADGGANRFWAGGFGHLIDAGGGDGFSGYSYDGRGVVLGYDRVLAPGLAAGVGLGSASGDYRDGGALAGNSAIESLAAGIYAAYARASGWFAAGSLSYVSSDNRLSDLRRDPAAGLGGWTENRYRNETWNLDLSGGRDIRLSDRLVLSPVAGLNIIRSADRDHDSFLGGVATHRASGVKSLGVFLPVGLALSCGLPLGPEAFLRLDAAASYLYALRRPALEGRIDYLGLAGPGGSSPRAAVASRPPSRHGCDLSLALNYALSQWSFTLRGSAAPSVRRLLASTSLSF